MLQVIADYIVRCTSHARDPRSMSGLGACRPPLLALCRCVSSKYLQATASAAKRCTYFVSTYDGTNSIDSLLSRARHGTLRIRGRRPKAVVSISANGPTSVLGFMQAGRIRPVEEENLRNLAPSCHSQDPGPPPTCISLVKC